MDNTRNKEGKSKLDKIVAVGMASITAVSPIMNPLVALAEETNSGDASPATAEVSPDEIQTLSFGEGETIHSNNGIRSYARVDGTTYFNVGNGTLYYKSGTKVTIEGTTLDESEGGINRVDSIRVLRKSDGFVLASTDKQTLEFEMSNIEGKDVNVEIASSAKGKTSIITLGTYLGNGFTAARQDDEAPTITGTLSGNVVENIYNGSVKGSYTLSDTISGLNKGSISVKLDGTSIVHDFSEGTGDLKFTIPDTITDDYHTLVISYSDNLGNKATKTLGFIYDKTAPTFYSATSSATPGTYQGKSYINATATMEYWVKDTATDITEVTVLRNGTNYRTGLSPKGSFTIADSGTYSLRVMDKAGNSKTYKLSEVFTNFKDEVVIDKTLATVTSTINSEPVSSKWYKDTAKFAFEVSDNIAIEKLEYTISGSKKSQTGVANGSKFTANLEDYVDDAGLVTVSIKVYDYAGNVTNYEGTYKVDKVNPTITDMDLAGEIHKESDGKIYFNKNLTLSADTADKESGTKKIEILNGSSVVGTALPFTVNVSGDYSVRVTDNVDHVTTVKLSSVLGAEYGKLVFDNTAPTIQTTLQKEDLLKDGKKWFKSDTTITFKPEDVNFKGIEFTVNGESATALHNPVDGTYVVSIPTNKYQGEVVVTAKATDKATNSKTVSTTIYMDSTNPEISASTLKGTTYKDVDGKRYFREALTLDSLTTDAHIGVKSVEVINNGNVVATKLPYTMSASGSYSVRVTDYLGNTTTKTLSQMIDEKDSSYNTMIWDVTNPVASLKYNNPVYVDGNKNWYADDASLTYNITETNLKQVIITVNGEEVVNDLDGKVKHSYDITVPKGIEGENVVEYTLIDKAMNETHGTDFVYIDTINPVISDVTLQGTVYKNKDGKIYFKTPLKLSGVTTDAQAGVKSVEIINKETGRKVSSALPYDITSSGKYVIKVTDNVGNVKEQGIEEFLGAGYDKLVFDNTFPIAETEIAKPYWVNEGKDWFREDTDVKLHITEINKETLQIKVNGKVVENVESPNVKDEYTIPIRGLEGKVTVEYTVMDKAENQISGSRIIYIDKSNPEISNMTLEGTRYEDIDGNVYFKTPLTMNADTSDKLSGVKKVEILKDGKVVKDANLAYIIGESGNYSVKVTDNMDYTYELSLAQVLGGNYGKLVFDNVAPDVKTSLTKAPNVVKDGNDWFNEDTGVKLDITETNLKTVDIQVNGKTVISDKDGNVKKSYTVPIDDSIQGKVVVSYTVMDKAMTVTTGSRALYVDTINPTAKSEGISGSYEDRGYGVFFKADGGFKVSVDDGSMGIGVKNIKLTDLTDNSVQENLTGDFKLFANGHEYQLSVIDELGNTTTYALGQFLGFSNEKIYVDTEDPNITSERPEGDVNGWYAGDKTYVAVASDANGVSSAVVTINGTVVDEFSASSIVKQKILHADTSKVKANADGSYHVNISMVSNSGKTTSWSDTVYMDRTAPVVDKFVFTGEGIQEGAITNGSDNYGFYFRGGADVAVHVSDGKVSSGMKTLYYTLTDESGKATEGKSEIKNGIAKFSIPEGFKGIVSARADDNVLNVGLTNKADGVITEDSNWHVNNKKLEIELPETPYKDGSGINLYNSSVTAKAYIGDNVSGIRTIEYGTGDKTLGTVEIGNDGSINGESVIVNGKDKNLVVDLDKALNVTENVNGLKLWVRVTDRSGYVSEESTLLSIDKDVPEISVTYDENRNDNYYATNRKARVVINERNFRESDVKITGEYGKVSGWTKGDGNEWFCDIEFTADKDYNWSVDYTDMAGNKAITYNSGNFTIDKTAPVLDVKFDNNSSLNGNFYKGSRTATVTIVDKNFDSSLVSLVGNGVIGAWSHDGDTHTAHVVFDKDGEYEFSIVTKDKAGNSSTTFSSGKFIIDMTNPTVNIEGVQDGVTYKKNVGFKINLGDTYIDSSNSSVKLVSRTKGEITVKGSFDEKTGTFSFEGFPDSIDFDDIYYLTVRVSDKAGNVTEKRVQFALNRYGSRYEFLGKDILNTYIKNLDGNIEITETSVNKLDEGSIKIVVIKDGKPYSIDKKYIHVGHTGGENSLYVYKYTIDKEAFKEDGKYQVQVYSVSTDGTENTSLREEYSFVLDTTPPEIIISGVEEGEFYNGSSQKVTIDIRDLSEIDELVVKVNGEKQEVTEEDGVYSLDIDESDEKQTIEVFAKDAAGNSASEKVKDFKISSDMVGHLLENTWFKVAIGAVIAFILGLIGILIGKKRKDSKKEQELAEEHAKMYRDSSSSSTGSKGSSDN